MTSITAKKVDAPADKLLDPDAPEWQSASEVSISLEPTPLALQTSEYIKAAWRDRPYGRIKEMRVRALNNGQWLLLRLQWSVAQNVSQTTDNNVFPDAVGVLFPLDGQDAPLTDMGSPQQPVNAWYWRADRDRPINVTANGRGTTTRHQQSSLNAHSQWKEGAWLVAMGRPLAVSEGEAVPLAVGKTVKAAFAVWEGANQERVGLKAFSPQWHQLVIEA